jgi:hypothetical protein
MNPGARWQDRRRKGLPNYRPVRYADDFVVLVHGTKSAAETVKAEIGELPPRRLKMTVSVVKTHITHIDDDFVFLGFPIQRRPWRDGRRVVLTIPSKPALDIASLGESAVGDEVRGCADEGREVLGLALGGLAGEDPHLAPASARAVATRATYGPATVVASI